MEMLCEETPLGEAEGQAAPRRRDRGAGVDPQKRLPKKQ